MKTPWLYFLFILFFSGSVKAQISFTDKETALGTIEQAYEIKGDIIIKNEGYKKVFLMRADADKGVKVFASKKTLQANDTALLIISFIPESAGKFKKKIYLVSSDSEKAHQLELSGNLIKLKADDKLACFYFGSRKSTSVKRNDGPLVVTPPKEPRDNSNHIPDNGSEPVVTYSPIISFTEDPKEAVIKENPLELSVLNYKPNNILFLVDVSSSMKDSLKLPLMKNALYTLIDAVRDIDKITFITYADSTRILSEAVSGADKEKLKEIVSSIKAKGMTKGNKAILKSQSVAQKHFMPEGNNQIILATDGKFIFTVKDQDKWNQNQGDKKIIISTVAFGTDKDALKNLKEISLKGGGSFIQVKKRNGSEEKLLEEIKLRSKR